jgi:hypothetical protein
MKKYRYYTVLLIIAILFVLAPSVSARSTPKDKIHHCGPGEVNSVLQALPVGFTLVNDFNNSIKKAGLGGGVGHCQFRVFFDGATFTYCERDLILGGLVWLDPYKAQGISRDEAIASISAIQDIIEFGPVGGSLVDQDLEYTSFKDVNHPVLGLTVYQQRAFTAQLDPGEYESVWTATFDDGTQTSATVRIVVLPHDLAH